MNSIANNILKYWVCLFILFSNSLQAQWAFPGSLIFPSVVGQNASSSQIAVDNNANAIIVYVYNGGPTNAIYASYFTKSTMSFNSPLLISPMIAGQPAARPQIGVDSNGNGIAVWRRNDGTANAIESARYDFSTQTWSSSVTLTNPSIAGLNANAPQIAVAPNGNAVAIWTFFDGTVTGIQAAAYDVLTDTWTAPVDLITPPVMFQDADNPQVGVDAVGNAVAVWQYNDGVDVVVQSATYNFSTSTWTSPLSLFPGIAGRAASTPQIDVAPNGNAVAIWSISDGTVNNIQSAAYDASGNTWTAPSSFLNPSIPGQNSFGQQIGVDAVGNAIGIWVYNDGTTDVIETANYDFASDTWSPRFNLTTPSIAFQPANGPDIAVTPDGNAVASWSYFDGTTNTVESANYHKSQNLWFGRFNVSRNTTPGNDASMAVIGVDPYGNAALSWTFFNGTANTIQLSVLNVTDSVLATVTADPIQVLANGTTSTITVTLLDHYGQAVEGNDVSLSPNGGNSVISAPSGPSDGSGVVTFTVFDFSQETVIYSATDETGLVDIAQTAQVQFANPVLQPPNHFNGKVVKNKFLNTSELANVLSWRPSSDTAVEGYRLYQNGVLIREFSANGPFGVIIPNCHKHRVYVYTLVAFGAGMVSSPVEITLRT